MPVIKKELCGFRKWLPAAACLVALVSRQGGLLAQGDSHDIELVLKSRWPGLPRAYISDVAVRGSYAYTADGFGGMRVFNVSEPATVRLVASVESTNGYGTAIVISGNFAYVTDSFGLEIVDISQPEAPNHVATIAAPAAASLSVTNGYAFV
jgi:hypothetical protein